MANFKPDFSEWDNAYQSLISLGFQKTAKSFCNAAISRICNAITRVENNQNQTHNLFVGASISELKDAEELWRERQKEIS